MSYRGIKKHGTKTFSVTHNTITYNDHTLKAHRQLILNQKDNFSPATFVR